VTETLENVGFRRFVESIRVNRLAVRNNGWKKMTTLKVFENVNN
jgi:hypothetical protein